jgi:hypothetical protein
MATADAFESFSVMASDWIRLRRALYGAEDAQALMLRCFRLSHSGRKVNERTVLRAWSEQDRSINKALGLDE